MDKRSGESPHEDKQIAINAESCILLLT